MGIAALQPGLALVLELVVLRGQGDGEGLILLGFGFGTEVAVDNLFLDRAVALEAQFFVCNAAQRGDAPQGQQLAVLDVYKRQVLSGT